MFGAHFHTMGDKEVRTDMVIVGLQNENEKRENYRPRYIN